MTYSIAVSSLLSAFRPSATVRNPGKTHAGKWRPDFVLIWVPQARSLPASFPGVKEKPCLLTVRAPSCHCNSFAPWAARPILMVGGGRQIFQLCLLCVISDRWRHLLARSLPLRSLSPVGSVTSLPTAHRHFVLPAEIAGKGQATQRDF